MSAKRPAGGGAWLTVFDVVVVLVGSAAIVALLGAQGRFTLAGALETVRSPVNLCIAAAALILLRIWLGGRQRLFPSIPLPDRSRFEADRIRLASPDPSPPPPPV